jgi:hypothetical protein
MDDKIGDKGNLRGLQVVEIFKQTELVDTLGLNHADIDLKCVWVLGAQKMQPATTLNVSRGKKASLIR